jgi:hypothetical protein
MRVERTPCVVAGLVVASVRLAIAPAAAQKPITITGIVL